MIDINDLIVPGGGVGLTAIALYIRERFKNVERRVKNNEVKISELQKDHTAKTQTITRLVAMTELQKESIEDIKRETEKQRDEHKQIIDAILSLKSK